MTTQNTTTENKYDLDLAIYNMVKDAINDGRLLDTNVSEIHNEVFNTDYFVIGTWEAKQWLNEYDVFAAIEKVMEYEKDNFGGVTTEIHQPERLLNMLVYILGEEYLSSLNTITQNLDSNLDEEIQTELLSEIEGE